MHYSGESHSAKDFWRRVERLTGKRQAALNACGAILKDLEVWVLQTLMQAETQEGEMEERRKARTARAKVRRLRRR